MRLSAYVMVPCFLSFFSLFFFERKKRTQLACALQVIDVHLHGSRHGMLKLKLEGTGLLYLLQIARLLRLRFVRMLNTMR